MKKQTAVEWLEQEIIALENHSVKELISLFNQAKEMEKEQIIDAYYYDPNCGKIKDDGEEYYNDTFS